MKKESSNFGFSMIIVVVVCVIVLAIHSAMQSALKGPAADMSDEAVAERIAQVGKLNTGEPMQAEAAPAPAASAAASGPRSGKAVYDSSCMVCHATGAAGAPKLGDTAAWAPRIDKGMDTLMNHAINGFNAMPPRGTCANCSDDELKAAIEYMIDNSK